MKILYRILTLLLWILVLVNMVYFLFIWNCETTKLMKILL